MYIPTDVCMVISSPIRRWWVLRIFVRCFVHHHSFSFIQLRDFYLSLSVYLPLYRWPSTNIRWNETLMTPSVLGEKKKTHMIDLADCLDSKVRWGEVGDHVRITTPSHLSYLTIQFILAALAQPINRSEKTGINRWMNDWLIDWLMMMMMMMMTLLPPFFFLPFFLPSFSLLVVAHRRSSKGKFGGRNPYLLTNRLLATRELERMWVQARPVLEVSFSSFSWLIAWARGARDHEGGGRSQGTSTAVLSSDVVARMFSTVHTNYWMNDLIFAFSSRGTRKFLPRRYIR